MIYLILWLVLGAYWIQSGKFLLKDVSVIDLIIVTPVILLFLFCMGIMLMFGALYDWVFKK